MIGTARSMRADSAPISASPLKSEMVAPLIVPGSLRGRRHAIDAIEPEDAQITGMTRSLDRRLLALNLKPVASVANANSPVLKVA